MNRFFDTKNSGTISVTPFGLGYNLYSTYNLPYEVENGESFYGESLIDSISHSSLNSFTSDLSGIIRALCYLNSKIEASRKTVSFWDAYQIRGAIEDRDQFLGQLAAMPANSSITSSLRDPFTWTDQNNELHTIYRGDIIIKDYMEQLHYIPSLNTGFYIPAEIYPVQDTANTYVISYEYATSQPAEDPQLQFDNINGTWGGYNLSGTLAPNASLSSIEVVNNVQPVVKFYTNTDNKEQVFLDNTYTLQNSGTTFTITNTTSVTLFYEVK